ncbi:MAG: 1-deoxy-D-xylulose-5-phosphate synthase [Bacteroidales bacterium]|nr:1-deoxy-D-xylulose-5-phosphate synthase [Candidatus Cryptobacteroides aphodequi]
MAKLLDSINSPADLRDLPLESLPQLCAEIRELMVEVCAHNPGHLASSLGAVELIVGIHYVFDTPEDKLLFDVGHQAYAHKILTGRRDAFRDLRTREGLSGFPNIFESGFDAFGVGHSSTALSAALGYAEAARIQGTDRHHIALVGDGALTGGMAFEALNNAGGSSADLLVVLNDNNQSIDSNIGGLHNHLLKITTSSSYNSFKKRVWDSMRDNRFRSFIQRWLRSLKAWFVKRTGGDLFESLGLRYFGPIDGNDIFQVVGTLRKLRDMGGPRVVHCITKKGKGYAPAEADPSVWHAPGKFDPATGTRLGTSYSVSRYQDVFGATLCELARADERVVGITPAMASGCGMTAFASEFPQRFFDVGIEEEHAVTFSAGLAMAGMRPFCNIYSSFSQRAYDQIIHDVALQKLPVVLCFDRAGLVGEDGATHCGAFDMAAYRSVPGCIISAPADELELRNLMFTALHHDAGPFIIRYPRGLGEGVQWKDAFFEELSVGKALELRRGSCVAVVAAGPCVHRALEAADAFPGKVGVYDFRFVKPLDTEMLSSIAASYKYVLTVEDGCLSGGLYGAVCEALSESAVPVSGLGIPDRFIAQDKQSSQRKECGIDTEGISRTLESILSR